MVLAGIQSVGIGACMHVCVWYTELTCILNWASKTDIVVGKVLCVCVLACFYVCGIQSRLVYRIGPLERTLWVRSSALVCVDRWPLLLPGTLNHWGRYLSPGSYHLRTVCLWRGHFHCWVPLTTGVEFYHRVLPYKITNN